MSTVKPGVLKNLYKYHEYILYYSKTMLKQKVAGNYLGFLWLLIQPLMFMLVYSFVVQIIFRSRVENIHIYVLIGLNTWNLAARTIRSAAVAVVSHKTIFRQVYFHKFVYPTCYLMSNVYEFLISSALVIVMIVVAGIPLTPHIFEMAPVLLTTILFTYGMSLIIAHIGVYLYDLKNILEFTLQFLFYLSPVMWSYDNLPEPYASILMLNPASIVMDGFRKCMMYGESPSYLHLLVLCLVSIVLIQVGYRLISHYEDGYSRII